MTHEMVDMEAFGEVKRKILEMKESLQFDETGGAGGQYDETER